MIVSPRVEMILSPARARSGAKRGVHKGTPRPFVRAREERAPSDNF